MSLSTITNGHFIKIIEFSKKIGQEIKLIKFKQFDVFTLLQFIYYIFTF